jgi:hypothetical protein
MQIAFPIARKPGMAWQQPQPTTTVRVAATVATGGRRALGPPDLSHVLRQGGVGA